MNKNKIRMKLDPTQKIKVSNTNFSKYDSKSVSELKSILTSSSLSSEEKKYIQALIANK